ncbi:MAG: ribosomal protein L7/L12 [Gemmataceae bacterium]|nr:ribosomal protein L7/L12 [Gemmataceae bacterium]
MDDRMFLDRLREDARDALTRSAYADWLEERGDPRGEYLRKEIELSAVAVDDPRFPGLARWVREREAMNDPAWMAEACPLWNAILLGYEPGRKINVIKALRELTGIGLADGKRLSEELPARVLKGVSFHAAWRAAAHLLQPAGAWPMPVRIEASAETKSSGPAWFQLPPRPTYHLRLAPASPGKRTQAAAILRELFSWPVSDARRIAANGGGPAGYYTDRESADAAAARFAGAAEATVEERPPWTAPDSIGTAGLPFDYWQR